MKKILRIFMVIVALFAFILGFLNLIGTITTDWNWGSFSLVIFMLILSIEQFSTKGEPRKVRNAYILGAIMVVACILNLTVFIKSILS